MQHFYQKRHIYVHIHSTLHNIRHVINKAMTDSERPSKANMNKYFTRQMWSQQYLKQPQAVTQHPASAL